ncbi:hypothetical protein EJ08DRAFT_657500 [Tothia fuscella]|uniref:Uncharacterized protein n=1 Tax=Tothia fuscella TaxID=1048955 RepID=A0A9P4NYV5_9PEZI|nr:hypothetical protein EJ08DRAFT_657500 [Tothia fuscella]
MFLPLTPHHLFTANIDRVHNSIKLNANPARIVPTSSSSSSILASSSSDRIVRLPRADFALIAAELKSALWESLSSDEPLPDWFTNCNDSTTDESLPESEESEETNNKNDVELLLNIQPPIHQLETTLKIKKKLLEDVLHAISRSGLGDVAVGTADKPGLSHREVCRGLIAQLQRISAKSECSSQDGKVIHYITDELLALRKDTTSWITQNLNGRDRILTCVQELEEFKFRKIRSLPHTRDETYNNDLNRASADDGNSTKGFHKVEKDDRESEADRSQESAYNSSQAQVVTAIESSETKEQSPALWRPPQKRTSPLSSPDDFSPPHSLLVNRLPAKGGANVGTSGLKVPTSSSWPPLRRFAAPFVPSGPKIPHTSLTSPIGNINTRWSAPASKISPFLTLTETLQRMQFFMNGTILNST